MITSGADVRIKEVHCTADAVIVAFVDGPTLSLPLVWYPRLLHASPEQRGEWRLIADGEGIHWPLIDEDLSAEGLLRWGTQVARAIVLEKGHGKDGDPDHPYVRAHSTNYNWREDIGQFTHRMVNREAFRGRIWINTYFHHPPGGEDDFWRHRDDQSFAVWGNGGRGDPLTKALGDRVFHVLFSDPNPPDIWWIIWQGRMWSRFQGGFVPAPAGSAGLDPGHFHHIHVTYLDPDDQRRLRGARA